MTTRQIPTRFQVAFSLAGEQRPLVRLIAEATEAELGRGTVFFDEWFEAYIAGDDADLLLQQIYGDRCTLAVVCVSGDYGGKPWTLAEHAAIRSRVMQARASAVEADRLGVLPIRVGDGDVRGILFNAIVPDVRMRSPEEAARLVTERLGHILPIPTLSKPTPSPFPLPPKPVFVPTGTDAWGLHEALRNIFPRRQDIEQLPLGPLPLSIPPSDDADELWEAILRQLRNCRVDIRPLLAAALSVQANNAALKSLCGM